jgi:hypothetical protein
MRRRTKNSTDDDRCVAVFKRKNGTTGTIAMPKTTGGAAGQVVSSINGSTELA